MSDLNQAVPETELLDNSIQKGRAQLSVRAHRHRPSRSRYRDSVSSTEGDDSLERRVRLPYGDIIMQTLMTSANVCVCGCVLSGQSFTLDLLTSQPGHARLPPSP